jgi:phosphoribosyl 1,2-cyclic phosphate phosphodiesterase
MQLLSSREAKAMQLIFLGCSDEHGVPRVGCECEICHCALSPGSRNGRTGPSIALRYGPSYAERLVLIDVAPEVRLQVTRHGVHQFDALLLTHAHDVHVLGLGILVDAQREAGQQLAVYAPAPVLDDTRERFGSLWADKSYRRVMQPKAINEAVDLWGLQAYPLRVDHGLGGTAYGYLLALGRQRLAYVADMLRPTTELRQRLTNLNLLVLGANHYYEGIEMWKRSVMDITAALELIREVAPQRAIITHLSHTIDYDQVSARLPPNTALAYDGLVLEVQE